MNLTPKDQQYIDSILHYMDEYPRSGQNREGAVIIRKLLSAAPLVAVIPTDKEIIAGWEDVFGIDDLEVSDHEIIGFVRSLISTNPISKASTDEVPQAMMTDEQIDIPNLIYKHTGLNSQQSPHEYGEVFALCSALVGTLPISKALEQGEVTVTTNEHGECIAVTRTDDENRVLSVIWMLETSKADTGEAIRNAALEKIMRKIMEQVDENIRPTVRDCVNGNPEYAQDIYEYCNRIETLIGSALKSATPSTIKAEPIGKQL